MSGIRNLFSSQKCQFNILPVHGFRIRRVVTGIGVPAQSSAAPRFIIDLFSAPGFIPSDPGNVHQNTNMKVIFSEKIKKRRLTGKSGRSLCRCNTAELREASDASGYHSGF